MTTSIVIVSATRTPLGKFGGALASLSAAELGAIVIKEALTRCSLKPEQVDKVLMGCVLQASLGQNVARQSALKAGLPVSVPAETLNVVCGSGLEAINTAAALIASGQEEIIVAGGTESMSNAPYTLEKARFGYRMNNGQVVDTLIKDALWDAFNDYHMGITAENIAERYGISRTEQDEFAANSQQKCQQAIARHAFQSEIVPVTIQTRKGPEVISGDEYPRPGVTAESLAKLKPAFKKEGTVTAANASGINDGAAAVVLMSEEKARELGLTPLARWVVGTIAGVEPDVMGLGPVASTQKALQKSGLTITDLDLIEANEAFAAQALAVGKDLGWDWNKVNVNGGAIAIGHPVGASGCRILVTLIHEMQRRGAKYGLATLCVGGGMGVSTIIERYKE